MNTNKGKTNKPPTQEQVRPKAAKAVAEAESSVKAKHIKLGVDVHLDRYVVVRILEGGTPQPPQRFGPAEFLLWVAKQITLAEKVFTCYEAGPFGYTLHRQLEKMSMGSDRRTDPSLLLTYFSVVAMLPPCPANSESSIPARFIMS